jgi:hypothetical protein
LVKQRDQTQAVTQGQGKTTSVGHRILGFDLHRNAGQGKRCGGSGAGFELTIGAAADRPA